VKLRLVLASFLLLLAACGGGGSPAAAGGPAGAGTDVNDGHRLLTADEAVDLARYRAWHYQDVGVVAGVPQAREVLVSRLPWSEARDFLKRVDPSRFKKVYVPRTRPYLVDDTEVFVVLVRGPVISDRGSVVADSLAMVVDRRARVVYFEIGAPWDKAVPPHAQAMATSAGPRLQDVSLARAQNEISGTPLVEPRKLPGGISLLQININPGGTEVDPSQASFAQTSVTLIYSDGAQRPRIWLSQAAFLHKPRLSGTPTPVVIGASNGFRYRIDQDGRHILAFAWERGDRSLYLAADRGSDLTEEGVLATAASIVVEGARPPTPVAASP
jgi:hypothetical protein